MASNPLATLLLNNAPAAARLTQGIVEIALSDLDPKKSESTPRKWKKEAVEFFDTPKLDFWFCLCQAAEGKSTLEDGWFDASEQCRLLAEPIVGPVREELEA